MIKPLRDFLPREFFSEFMDSPVNKMLDVLAEESNWQADRPTPFPGGHKNVNVWWKLDNGYAVGWNENPGRGWSFPLVKMRSVSRVVVSRNNSDSALN
jgi:hypothetical protein